MQIIELPTQTGIVNYSVALQAINSQSSFLCGFSGVTGSTINNIFIGFSGNNGCLYDNQGNFFGGYQPGINFTISGFVYPTYHAYFYNNNLINTNCSRPTGYLEAFVYKTGTSLSTIAPIINGNPGYIYVSGGVMQSGNITGSLLVFNQSPISVRFKLYSGLITSGPYTVNILNSGYITGEYDYQLIANTVSSTTGITPATGVFYTNFGIITTGFNVTTLYNYNLLLQFLSSLYIGSGTSTTGQLNYAEMLGGAVSSNITMPVSITFKNSGIISDTAPSLNNLYRSTLLTGTYTGTSPNYPTFNFSGAITGSGYLGSMDSIVVSGFNYIYSIADTGIAYASNIISDFYYATGIFNMPWQTLGTGLVTGYALMNLLLTGYIPSGNYISQYYISGLGYANYQTGFISGTGFSFTFQNYQAVAFTGTGTSLTSLAYATGSGQFGYSGYSTGLYSSGAYSGFMLYAGNVSATGIVSGNFSIRTGVDNFTTGWSGTIALQNQIGGFRTFTGFLLQSGIAYYTGTFVDNTGEMYMTGLISGTGYTGAGFVYSSGFNYSGSWNPLMSGQPMTLIGTSGFLSGATPLNAFNTGVIYTPTNFLSSNITPTIITGTSGFILLSTINAPNINIIPDIILSGNQISQNLMGRNASNYVTNNIWIKHLRNGPGVNKTGVYTYGVFKYKGTTGNGYNIDISPNNFNYNINTFLCPSYGSAFSTGYYTTVNNPENNALITNVNETNYSKSFGSSAFDSGVYIRIASQLSNPISGLLMFVWNSGALNDLQIKTTREIKNGQLKLDGGFNQYFSGGLYSGQTFAAENPTGNMTAFYASEPLFQSLVTIEPIYPRTTGTLFTGIQTGAYVSGYLNQTYTFTGITGTKLLDILIDPTGAIATQQFVYPLAQFEQTPYYNLGYLHPSGFLCYPTVQYSGGFNYSNDASGICHSIISGFSGFGFNASLNNSNISITYTGGYTGNAFINLGGGTSLFSGGCYVSGTGLTVNSNYVTGRTMNYTPNITGYSLWTGIISLINNAPITGFARRFYSGQTLGTGTISGQLNNTTINWGSGYYLFGEQFQTPITGIGIPFYSTSGLVAVAQFSGFPLPFIGTGYYATGINMNNIFGSNPLTGLYFGITFNNTFNNQYGFATGLDGINFSNVPFISPASGFSGYANISGSGILYFTITKFSGFTGDTLILGASGYGQSTAQSILMSNT